MIYDANVLFLETKASTPVNDKVYYRLKFEQNGYTEQFNCSDLVYEALKDTKPFTQITIRVKFGTAFDKENKPYLYVYIPSLIL